MSLVRVNYWAEGPTDRAAARKLIEYVGGEPGDDYSRRRGASPGRDYLDKNLRRYNAAAQQAPWLVLRDGDGECAKELAARLLINPAPKMRFRIVVPAMEAWLLADRQAMAEFMGVATQRLPLAPEECSDIKAVVVNLARQSRSRSIRTEMIPALRSGRREGPGYAALLIDFINTIWEPERAAENAQTLRRAIDRLGSLVKDCRG